MRQTQRKYEQHTIHTNKGIIIKYCSVNSNGVFYDTGEFYV